VVLEQAETMAEAAANALLKTLEEPGQATLILHRQLNLYCQPWYRAVTYSFYRLDLAGMTQVLRRTGNEEILTSLRC